MKDVVEQVGPAWSVWASSREPGAYTLGVEEEAMLLDPRTWALAHRIEELLPRLPAETQSRVSAETHGSAFEVQTGIAGTVAEAVDEIRDLRSQLERTLATLGLRADARPESRPCQNGEFAERARRIGRWTRIRSLTRIAVSASGTPT